MVIFVILIANGGIGIYQDYNAEKAIDALKNLQTTEATCLRSGEWKTINAVDIVPGDIVKLEQGKKVPADVRICKMESFSLKIVQAELTGEANPVSKFVDAVDTNADLISKSSMCFSGTLVTNGVGVGVVSQTGMNTEIGLIHALMQSAKHDNKD